MERRTRRPERPPEQNDPQERAQASGERALRIVTLALLCGIVILSIVLAVLVLSRRQAGPADPAGAAATASPAAYDPGMPFGASELTQAQLQRAMQEGSFDLEEGEAVPRGISLGDSIDTVLDRLPVAYSADMETDLAVLYSAAEDGQTLLPPYATLSVASDKLEITLVAPMTELPEDVGACFVKSPSVWCRYTIDPTDNTVSRITLGASNL